MGTFCKIYGENIRNQILEYMLENQELDFAVGDMAKELNISRPKAYELIKTFENEGYINKSRVIGKTQLYILNKENNIVKLFLRDFKECLKLVAEEYSEDEQNIEEYRTKNDEPILARVFLGNIDI
ncbi:MAG: helix-turn-helix domain-containing protein, partial [Nanoarchaeota archaeon]|nr:helix-turn-helix domain-containing protein [Nanoarchaeota archaeon]